MRWPRLFSTLLTVLFAVVAVNMASASASTPERSPKQSIDDRFRSAPGAVSSPISWEWGHRYLAFVQQQKAEGLKFQSPIPVTAAQLKNLEQQTGSWGSLSLGLHTETSTFAPHAYELPFFGHWRVAEEDLFLRDLSAYRVASGQRAKEIYAMSTNGALTYRLNIFNTSFKEEISSDGFDPATRFLEAYLSCDRRVKVRFSPRTLTRDLEGQYLSFRLFAHERNARKQTLEITDPNTTCVLRFKDSVKDEFYGLRLVPEDKAFPELFANKNKFELCALPTGIPSGSVDAFMLNSHYNSMTCPMKIDNIEMLEEGDESLNAKVKALTGKGLPSGYIEAGRPEAPLDLSQAPHLDEIYISYLRFRADFTGHLLARLLKFHADRGTLVRIIASGPSTKGKDTEMLHRLVNSSSRIKLLNLKYISQEDFGVAEQIRELHRSMHVKVFATLCHRTPDCERNNVTIIGGRNIHDGFLYVHPPDHSWNNDMIHYGKDEKFIHWKDFEVSIRSSAFARKVVQHLYTLWNHDSDAYTLRSLNLNLMVPKTLPADYLKDQLTVRHFISVPYADNQVLEDFYAQMFDSARSDIRLVSPYFRPTVKVATALNRAIERGVKVTLLTRINLKNDDADLVLSDVNKKGINQFLNKMKIYEWTDPLTILHSKIVLIDGRFTFVGSVNLNKRSFYHDTENGLMIHSREFHQRMADLLKTYERGSREVVKEQKVALIKSLIIAAFDTALTAPAPEGLQTKIEKAELQKFISEIRKIE